MQGRVGGWNASQAPRANNVNEGDSALCQRGSLVTFWAKSSSTSTIGDSRMRCRLQPDVNHKSVLVAGMLPGWHVHRGCHWPTPSKSARAASCVSAHHVSKTALRGCTKTTRVLRLRLRNSRSECEMCHAHNGGNGSRSVAIQPCPKEGTAHSDRPALRRAAVLGGAGRGCPPPSIFGFLCSSWHLTT